LRIAHSQPGLGGDVGKQRPVHPGDRPPRRHAHRNLAESSGAFPTCCECSLLAGPTSVGCVGQCATTSLPPATASLTVANAAPTLRPETSATPGRTCSRDTAWARRRHSSARASYGAARCP
jgi:hypothetical protein